MLSPRWGRYSPLRVQVPPFQGSFPQATVPRGSRPWLPSVALPGLLSRSATESMRIRNEAGEDVDDE